MGRRTVTCPLDLPDYPSKIHRRNTLLYDLRSRGYNSSWDWIPYVENKFLYSRQKWWTIGEEPRLNWRAKGKCHSLTGLLPTQAQARIWCQCETKATSRGRLGLKKGCGSCKEPDVGKIGTQLGRVISYHIGGWNRCLLPWRFGRKSCTTTLECT